MSLHHILHPEMKKKFTGTWPLILHLRNMLILTALAIRGISRAISTASSLQRIWDRMAFSCYKTSFILCYIDVPNIADAAFLISMTAK